ncbi:MAG: hypothetical protein NT129_05935 [Candidatus Aenigmarchaeota archaeon]|nr:hypothetical protein [Candidatus Aenigmarchaeota archaeon]
MMKDEKSPFNDKNSILHDFLRRRALSNRVNKYIEMLTKDTDRSVDNRFVFSKEFLDRLVDEYAVRKEAKHDSIQLFMKLSTEEDNKHNFIDERWFLGMYLIIMEFFHPNITHLEAVVKALASDKNKYNDGLIKLSASLFDWKEKLTKDYSFCIELYPEHEQQKMAIPYIEKYSDMLWMLFEASRIVPQKNSPFKEDYLEHLHRVFGLEPSLGANYAKVTLYSDWSKFSEADYFNAIKFLLEKTKIPGKKDFKPEGLLGRLLDPSIENTHENRIGNNLRNPAFLNYVYEGRLPAYSWSSSSGEEMMRALKSGDYRKSYEAEMRLIERAVIVIGEKYG